MEKIMSSSFEWDKYEEKKPKEKSKFDWDKFEKTSTSGLEKRSRSARQFAIGMAENVAAPYDIIASTVPAYKPKEGVDTGTFWKPKVLDKDQLEKVDLSVGGNLEKLLGVGHPEGAEENIARFAGGIVSPKQLLNLTKKAPGYIKSLANKDLRVAAKTAANWKRLEIASKGSPEKQTLLKFAQEKQLSPEAATALLHSKGSAENLGKLAKGKKYENVVKELNQKLGKEYEELKSLGKQGGYLNSIETDKLADEFGKVLTEMNATVVVGPDTAPVIKTVEDAIQRLNNNPNSVKELINSRQALGKGIDWSKMEKGDFYKSKLHEAITNAIKEKNPSIGDRLIKNDKAWARYSNYQEILDKRLPHIKVPYLGLEIPKKWLTGLAFTSAILPLPIIGKSAAAYAAIKEGIQRLSTEMLLNPKFQAPLKRLQDAIIHGDQMNMKRAFLMIKNIAKDEAPESYEEIKDLELS